MPVVRNLVRSASGETYYHASLYEFRQGEIVKPASQGLKANWNETNPEYAYAMKSLDDAWRWADKGHQNHVYYDHQGEYLACMHWPMVFEVVAVNPADVVDEDMPWSGVMSKSGFRVVRQMPDPDL